MSWRPLTWQLCNFTKKATVCETMGIKLRHFPSDYNVLRPDTDAANDYSVLTALTGDLGFTLVALWLANWLVIDIVAPTNDNRRCFFMPRSAVLSRNQIGLSVLKWFHTLWMRLSCMCTSLNSSMCAHNSQVPLLLWFNEMPPIFVWEIAVGQFHANRGYSTKIFIVIYLFFTNIYYRQ